MAKLSSNDAAPDLALPDQHGRTVRLADFGGGKLLIYFYPKADTPGCTRQACSIRDAREELRGLGLAVVGISPDQPARHRSSTTSTGLTSPSWRTRTTGWRRPTAPGARRLRTGRKVWDHPLVVLDRRGGEDRGGLVRDQTGGHGAQGGEGVAGGLSGEGGQCPPDTFDLV